MTTDDLDPELRELGTRLQRERPLPQPAFRGDLGRRLNSRRTTAPRYLRQLVAGQLAAGGLLLAVAAAGVLGQVGPLSL